MIVYADIIYGYPLKVSIKATWIGPDSSETEETL